MTTRMSTPMISQISKSISTDSSPAATSPHSDPTPPLPPTANSTSSAPPGPPPTSPVINTLITSISTTPTPTLSSSTTLPPISTSTTLTPSQSPTPPSNLTITHPSPPVHTGAIIGISIGSSIALILILSILITWYIHIRSRNKRRREEEIELATNSQGTFIGGWKLAKLNDQGSPEYGAGVGLGLGLGVGMGIADEVKTVASGKGKVVGVRRSNTREDGRRNGVVLRIVNPQAEVRDSALDQVGNGNKPHRHNFERGTRARFDEWNCEGGIPFITHEAETNALRKEQDESKMKTEDEAGTNVEIIVDGVKRMRSTLDAWKTGAVPIPQRTIPEVKITAATPVLGDDEMGHARKGKKRGPATFEDMGLKSVGKGLGVDLHSGVSVTDTDMLGAGLKEEEKQQRAWWENP
ncbi:hypothetical protein EG329_004529 [Mollisiaceae sp. DMI_Dod_QoI]|nr:hypothetical protein EG329_004529 [Helotiales sp. DMI_Dod_QoI]